MDNKIPASIVRQPPLPPAARKEGKIKQPEMVAGNSRSTRTYYLKSCKRKRLTGVESLPDEVLFEVLVRLPAQDNYDPARLVCSKWYHMIHTHTFIYTHLQHSTYGLLFRSMLDKDSLFMAVGESGRVEISKHRYKLRHPAQTSCNGLLLQFQIRDNGNYYFHVSNPTTRQNFYLPPFAQCLANYKFFGIAYAAASMEYKAVVLVCPSLSKKRLCYILTIGVDKSWRTVGTECSSLATTQVFGNAPLITEGFVHWYHITNNEVLTLNVETEIITETSCRIPRIVYENRRDIYLSTGRYLSLLIPSGEFCWEAWEMKPKIDYRWRKVWDISLEAHKCSTFQRLGFQRYGFLSPIGWLKYLEILLFTVNPLSPLIFAFNLRTQEMVTIELPDLCVVYKLVVHKNSLVWLGGC